MLQEKALKAVDSNKKLIDKWNEDLLNCPEMGYFEHKTSEYVKDAFRQMGIAYEDNLALTGFKATLCGRQEGPNICMMFELDAVLCGDHEFADKTTGAAHACGHSLQIVQMLAVARALKEIEKDLKGKVTFLACPAEEYAEIERRSALIKDGKISCIGGKQQLIVEGAFDDVDMAIMLHSHAGDLDKNLYLSGGSLGFISKIITFTGKETHGSTPHLGINALSAAGLCLAGINANRETFAEHEKIKIHPIITKGGEMINSIPKTAEIQTYIRGSDIKYIESAAKKVDNCALAAAMMIGAKANIETLNGYLPLMQDDNLTRVFAENAKITSCNFLNNIYMIGSSDIGDLSHILPAIQPTFGGFSGTAHGSDFKSVLPNYHLSELPKALILTVIDLLNNNKAQKIIDEFKPLMTKEQYKNYILQKGL